jgi:hypothetical protein
MQLLDDQLIVSASDLNNHLACAHLTTLDLARARGELEVELERGADAELLARKGDEYEDRYLASLKDEGREVVEIAQGDGSQVFRLLIEKDEVDSPEDQGGRISPSPGTPRPPRISAPPDAPRAKEERVRQLDSSPTRARAAWRTR